MKLGANVISVAAIMASTAVAALGESVPWERLDKNDSLLVIVDLQEGLYNLARDWDPTLYRQNLLAYASLATVFPMPVILTTSAETGPNGPLPQEIQDWYPTAPFIKRLGEVDAWDNSDFRAAVRASNKSQIIIGGIVTDVCTAFLARSLRAEGYSVWAVLEASGTTSAEVRDIANAGMLRAGVNVVSLFYVVCDLMRDWRNTPGAVQVFPWLDKWMPVYGQTARSHKFAVQNGTVLAGENLLPI
ncbi:Isochorismatase-like protein [Lasiosphaeria miniovina]|uniref:Isochorismatase-like protein n=1 Tax=Lasiosphaeria miniovina TaxID=1954250 RepID=A0AA40E2V7_9PEZI|nr:Isochorismatase-like protein [Lasiosphaeria miniovina]KAK0722947.1 Isochorismatase-like protein [Lasiosphaeria miniovina]